MNKDIVARLNIRLEDTTEGLLVTSRNEIEFLRKELKTAYKLLDDIDNSYKRMKGNLKDRLASHTLSTAGRSITRHKSIYAPSSLKVPDATNTKK